MSERHSLVGSSADDPRQAGAAFVTSPGVSWVANEDGVIVLEATVGKYFTFNGVAEFVWLRLAAGQTVEATLAALAERFPVDRERLAADLDRLLDRLLGLKLLTPAPPGARPPARAEATPVPAPPSAGSPPAAQGGAELGPFAELRLALLSVLGLAALDILRFGCGFDRFQRFVATTRVRSAVRPLGADGISALCRAVDRGARFYFKRAWCLERSALTTWLLRRRGIAAEMVIGVRAVPFLAHAWVEVGGTVVNDQPAVQRFYDAISRI